MTAHNVAHLLPSIHDLSCLSLANRRAKSYRWRTMPDAGAMASSSVHPSELAPASDTADGTNNYSTFFTIDSVSSLLYFRQRVCQPWS